MKSLSRLLCVVLLAGCAGKAPEGTFVRNEAGVIVTPADGEQRRVRLEVRTDRTLRVTSVANGNLDLPASLMVVPPGSPRPDFKVEKRDGEVVLSTSRVVAHVSLANGAVKFTDPAGKADPTDPVPVGDLHATVLAAVGIGYDKMNQTPLGRTVRICDGKPVKALLS